VGTATGRDLLAAGVGGGLLDGNTVMTDMSTVRREKLLERKREMDLEEQRRRRFEQHRQESRRQQLESERKVREAVLRERLKQEDKFLYHTSELLEGNKLVGQITQSLDLQEAADKNKARRQFDEWNRNVYGKLQGRISQKLDAMDYKQLNQRKNSEFQKFLDTTNTKGAIFRDIIIESEYDPLEPNRHSIRVPSSDVVDPCSRAVDKNIEEVGMLASPKQVRAMKKPKAREVLHVEEWATGKIEATPHGFFAKIMKSSENKPKLDPSQLSGTWRSDIPFDHYTIARGKQVTDSEFPRGKRTQPDMVRKNPIVGTEGKD